MKPIKSSFAGFTAFSKRTKGVFKGANHATLRAEAYKDMIKIHNNSVNNVKGAFNNFNKISGKLGQIGTVKKSFKD